MHYLLTPSGSTGDIHPFMSLAKALQAMGREVSFMAPAFHAGLVGKSDIPFIGLGTDADYLRIIANPDLWHPRRGFKALFSHYREPLIEAFHALMNFRHREPLTIIGHPFSLPAIAMARENRLRARVVGIYLAPSNIRTVHDPLHFGDVSVPRWVPFTWRRAFWKLLDRSLVDPHAAAALNEARAALGLTAIRQSFLLHMQDIPDLSVTLFPQWFAAPQPDWPRPLLMGDFQLFDASAQEPFSRELAKFLANGPAPVVVTPGTGNAHAADLFALSAQAVQNLGLRAIFLTRHHEQIPAHLPAHILWQPYVALAKLLPHAAALVHHGGIGTTAEALHAGIPQLVVPFAWDQFDNAARIKALGVATSLPAPRLRLRKLQAAMASLFHDDGVKNRCTQIAARFKQGQGTEALCRSVESALQTLPA
jgi:rhamnosyltransferase subunit B